MSKLFRLITSSSARYRHSLDVDVNRANRRTSYGRLGAEGGDESSSPSLAFRVPRKFRILKLSNRTRSNSKDPTSSLLGRLRVAYERWMLKAGSAAGEFTAIPIAKASRAPAALSSALSTWVVSASFGSRKGTKIADLDPGFKMTAAEKKYLEHLKRSASMR